MVLGPARGGDRHPSRAQSSFLGRCRSRQQLCTGNSCRECLNLPCHPFLCPPNPSGLLDEALSRGSTGHRAWAAVGTGVQAWPSEEIRAERSCCHSLSHLLRAWAGLFWSCVGDAGNTLFLFPANSSVLTLHCSRELKVGTGNRAGAGILLWASCSGSHSSKSCQSSPLLCLQTGQQGMDTS